MLDIKFIRENPDAVKQALVNRKAEADVDGLLELDQLRRAAITEAEELKTERNAASKAIGGLMKDGKKDEAEAAKEEVRKIGDRISVLDEQVRELDEKIANIVLFIPNMPSETTPVGASEEDNPVLRSFGEIKEFDFEVKPHWDICEELKLVDFERGSKITGSGFPVYTGQGARLQRALIQFMLDLHTTEHGYTEVEPPFVCNAASMTGTGQLPKFAEDMYYISTDELYPVPTAEVPVTNLYREEIIDVEEPVKLTAYTPCFRREAGAAGSTNRGLLRLHQFDKVEMVNFVKPEQSAAQHEILVGEAEKVLQKLGLHYRVIELCTADLGFSAAKCYDIELWAPGVERWLEVSSVSNFSDYQARRARIRCRYENGKPQFVHTLNGSGVALPRLVVAIIENNQNADGTVTVPEALRPYMGGLEKLG
ncbi:serine--tRNA ligase [Tichowtungia aerotolerans]|uniref:Serine--tRNA ligase n=1 Tax=Tichowtungia aerotolerans TaxID=2697043 RepID=A0A6P1M638_9BACT|nr:serine--tRNA ligase [Tichowtungia aerotolerans]QHI69492.1 serine--tRNA ligase [Tichowtungia aerotolerans]